MRTVLGLLFGRWVAEYLGNREAERKRQLPGRDEELNGKAKWIAAEHDWPAQHDQDVDDHVAARLIRNDDFARYAGQVSHSLELEPLRTRESRP
jgi:hypothetical protein